MMSAQDAFVVNHLCAVDNPVIAVGYRSCRDDSGVHRKEGLGQRESTRDLARRFGYIQRCFCASVGAVGE